MLRTTPGTRPTWGDGGSLGSAASATGLSHEATPLTIDLVHPLGDLERIVAAGDPLPRRRRAGQDVERGLVVDVLVLLGAEAEAVQIFDVSNPADPKLTHKEIIGTRDSSSEALTNHLAFTYFAPKNILALPMTVCEGGNTEGGYGTEMTFSGLMVFDVTATGGFKLRGKVSHPSEDDTRYGGSNVDGYSNCACRM